ncbi:MAG: lytic murein transglycosylase B [Thiomargarita sp.]|nr:lytic murein transglycosylase B [Thiomargarita sp.]
MKIITTLLLSGLLLYSVCTTADTVTQDMFIEQMVTQHGFDKVYVTQLLKQAKVKKSILKIMARPPGKAKPWYQYKKNFLDQQRIKAGIKFGKKYAKTLKRAEVIYGVPAEIIVAIIGVETFYGKIVGKIRVIDALKTLAFHYPKRADFFRDELEHFLLLTREEKMNPLKPKGSYAGAMGIGQFMPSSFRTYAVDFDGDGKRNIWTNNIDVIGSVANYFKQHGWKTGQSVIMPAQITTPKASTRLLALDFKPQYTLQKLKRMGLQYQGNESDNTLAMFIDLETEVGTAYWVGFQNYYVITRYNRSKHYAMAIFLLSLAVANR